jgi:hypothetical protein
MFFCVSLQKTAAVSIAAYINGGSQEINLPCLYYPQGGGGTGEPQAPTGQRLRLYRQVLPEPGL